MRLQIRQLALLVMIFSCYSTLENITGCVGRDVNIPWEYPDSAGMSSVSWEHIDSSNVKITILVQGTGSPATVVAGYNIQHNTNGDVTITTATVANSGTFRITVIYSSATPIFTDDVVVNVYDPPTGFSFSESPSGSQTTFTCTATSLGDTAANLYIQVNGVDQTSSVSATVSETDTVKCILSGPSVQCMSGVSGTVTSLCAQCLKYDCFWRDSLDSCLKCWGFLALIIVVILLVVIIIGSVVEAIFDIWESMSWEWRFVSFCVFLFGLGLYLCDYFKKWLKGKPAPPVITSQSNSPNPTSILVEWEKPSDRGYAILFYKITYQKVEFCCICCRNKIDVMVEIKDIKETSFTIDNLSPGTYYEVKVYAINEKGSSSPGLKDFLTHSEDDGKSWAFCCCCLAGGCCLAGQCCVARAKRNANQPEEIALRDNA